MINKNVNLNQNSIKNRANFLNKSNILLILIGLFSSSFIYILFGFNIIGQKSHKLAIVVPFRERFDELLVFVPHISKYLKSKSIDFKIYIINQNDDLRFNRASLINIGFLSSMNEECDYMAMHDVDLLPLNDLLDYSYPNNGPYHLSTSGLHPEYNYSKFIGGILIISKEHFTKVNGMSNRYYGWGKEDDEFYLRLKEANLTIYRPNITEFKTGTKFTFFHNHDTDKRPRDKKRYLKQKKESLIYDTTGLNNIQYKIKSEYDLNIQGFECKIINVELFCDRTKTHWCNTDYQFFD